MYIYVCVCVPRTRAQSHRGFYWVYQETIITRFQHFAIRCQARLRYTSLRFAAEYLRKGERRGETRKHGHIIPYSRSRSRGIHTPRMSHTDWRQVRVRTYAYRRGPAACACVGGTKSKKKREREGEGGGREEEHLRRTSLEGGYDGSWRYAPRAVMLLGHHRTISEATSLRRNSRHVSRYINASASAK